MAGIKAIIAGSRSITRYSRLAGTMELVEDTMGWPEIDSVICGCADGVDKLGFKWARANNRPVLFYPAWPNQLAWAERNRRDGEKIYTCGLGKAGDREAGGVRNGKMGLDGDGAVLLWDGRSPGTRNMRDVAQALDLLLYVDVFRQTQVVQVRQAPYDIYVGRGKCPTTGKWGEWGNPWSHKPGIATYHVGTVEEAVEQHRLWLKDNPQVVGRVRRELAGKVLGCWCDGLCHGMTLARVADGEEP